ncbi:hypothetical protein [Faecalispora anaeroviscerum]|uniref:hypothetical protein n=1 Tax=Faecalispora anaeroviscerum TaxID=2991836 RepID=UPI0024BA63A0|nr:hypothetical protein [Faecalispora anaeroviscerum]
MKSAATIQEEKLTELCRVARLLIHEQKYEECERLISNAMGTFPHAPHPHNLMGILLEQESNTLGAMRHFRCAWALDPTYLPARYNLNRLGSLTPDGECAYEESDCGATPHLAFCTRRDPNGIIHVMERRAER